MLLVIGDAVHETVVDLRAAPSRGGVGAAHITHRRGGSAANIAAFSAEVRTKARFAGQVGDDHTGAFLLDDMGQHGVDVRASRHGRSASAVIVRSNGTTTRLVDRATATQLTTLDSSLLTGVAMVHLPASSLSIEPLATAVEDLVGEAVERGIPITIDAAGIATIDEFGATQMRSLIAHLRPAAFFCNRIEAQRLGLAGREPMPGARHTIITAGASPTIVVDVDGAARSVPVTPVSTIIDRDGAGDAFITGYLIGLLAGQPAGTCVRAGHLLASRVLGHAGPRMTPMRDEPNESAAVLSTMS